jgi:hypothetical protein
MGKDTFYFSHDYNARNDPKMQKLLRVLGQQGKGCYWDLVEMLYEEGGYLILSQCEDYAFALRVDISCITSLINDFSLFESDGEKFWSNSVIRRLDERKDKSLKASKSAKKRWGDANALRTQSEGNAIKERKGKEIKGKERKEYIVPLLSDVVIFFTENGYSQSVAEKAYQFYQDGDWKDSNGKKVLNWKQKMRVVWFRDEHREDNSNQRQMVF